MKGLRNTAAMMATMWPSHNLRVNPFHSNVLSLNATLRTSGWDSMSAVGGLGVSGSNVSSLDLETWVSPSFLNPLSSDSAWKFLFFQSQMRLKYKFLCDTPQKL